MDLPQFSLDGKVALVTGGSRGIGEAAAVTLARAGADVAVSSRKLPDLERVAGEVEKLGRRAVAVAAHVGRMDQIQPLVDRVVDELGSLDILVNNAGTNFFSPAIDMEERAWDTVFNLDLKGLFFLSQAAARVMREKGDGRIVNVSSVSGYRVQVPTGHYSIAKAGVMMATKVMALEWSAYGIRVNCVAPGAVGTRLYDSIFSLMPEEQSQQAKEAARQSIPMQRVGRPTEIADAILFLASDASSYMTGQSFAVDGGALLT
jgi:NAD(P)-dependent dehydrogenase (short-subunit alcohol dehydrogenase family)